MRGVFITFEGPEGSGKSTHAKALVGRLQQLGIEVVSAREPGGTPMGEAIRGIVKHNAAGSVVWPETEALLFGASRAHLVRSVILPALESGKWVICDRFMDSTTAYQAFARGLDRKKIDSMNALAVGKAVPNMTLLLDLNVRKGFRRIAARKTRYDRFEMEKISFHEKVRRGYLALARQFPRRFVRIDACGTFDAVDAMIWSVVKSRFLAGGRRRNGNR
jgi:dTMP kinase